MPTLIDSKIDWIGKIPSDWSVGKVKYLFFRKNVKAGIDDPVVLSLARSGVKVRDISTGEGQLAENYSEYNIVEPGDLLLNPMDLYSGANCSLSNVSGVISPAYINLKAKNNINPKFYDYFFKTQYWSMAFFAHGKGVSFDNRWTLGLDTAMNYYIPILDIRKQDKIVNYLDKVIDKINDIIDKTQETIEDYKKYRQNIITNAVTKGIGKYLEYKPIKGDNLDNIPLNWNFRPLKYNVILNSKSLSESTDENYEFKYVEIGSVNIADGITEYQQCTFKNAPSRARRIVKKGDVIVSTVRTYLKAIATIDDDKDTIVSTGFAVLEPVNINKEYLSWVLKSDYFTDLVSSRSNGISYPAINSSDLINLKIPVPRDLHDQEKIVSYLNYKCTKIDELIKEKENMIEDLEEYKKSIIYEYTTGKKEVK